MKRGYEWNSSGLRLIGNFDISSVVPLVSTVSVMVQLRFKNQHLVLFTVAFSNVMWLNHNN